MFRGELLTDVLGGFSCFHASGQYERDKETLKGLPPHIRDLVWILEDDSTLEDSLQLCQEFDAERMDFCACHVLVPIDMSSISSIWRIFSSLLADGHCLWNVMPVEQTSNKKPLAERFHEYNHVWPPRGLCHHMLLVCTSTEWRRFLNEGGLQPLRTLHIVHFVSRSLTRHHQSFLSQADTLLPKMEHKGNTSIRFVHDRCEEPRFALDEPKALVNGLVSRLFSLLCPSTACVNIDDRSVSECAPLRFHCKVLRRLYRRMAHAPITLFLDIGMGAQGAVGVMCVRTLHKFLKRRFRRGKSLARWTVCVEEHGMPPSEGHQQWEKLVHMCTEHINMAPILYGPRSMCDTLLAMRTSCKSTVE